MLPDTATPIPFFDRGNPSLFNLEYHGVNPLPTSLPVDFDCLMICLNLYLIHISLTAFSFPLTAGLAFALYAGLVLTPLLWYEFRFGRESRTEPDSAE